MDKKWYANIYTQPGYEQRVKTTLRRKIGETIEAGKAAARPKVRFDVGEKVKVIDGPFRDFTGTVQAIRPERSRLRVAVSVFGRPTPVDLDFIQVEAA